MNQVELTDVNVNGFRNYNGGYFKTLISPEQSGGSIALLDIVLPKGAEPPPHIHTNEDESFYVMEGSMMVHVGNKTTILNAGDALYAPRKVAHHFKILTPHVRMLNLIKPGALWNYFIEFSTACVGEPTINYALPQPSAEEIAYLLHVLTDKYELNFLQNNR